MDSLPLFAELSGLPPCSLCRSPGFRRGCARCESRSRLFRVRSEAELGADAAAAASLRAERAAEVATAEARLERLRALGRPVRVHLVGCGKAKASTPRAAQDLYLGSLFRAGRRFAEARADEWFILSALHGLVVPSAELAPYELALRTLGRRDREAWGARIAGALQARYRGLQVTASFLAGVDYVRWVSRALPSHWSVETPLARLGLGARLQWLHCHSAQGALEEITDAAA